jgi:hypothetical protein
VTAPNFHIRHVDNTERAPIAYRDRGQTTPIERLTRKPAFLTVEADTRYERADQAAFSEDLTRTDQGKHERVTGGYSEATGAVRRKASGGGSFGVTRSRATSKEGSRADSNQEEECPLAQQQ